MSPDQLLTIILAVATVLSSIATAVTAYIVYQALNQSSRGQQAQIFSDIVLRYNEVYVYRNQILEMNLTALTANDLSIVQILNSEQWRIIRQAASFFEYVGILVKRKYIDKEILFDMIYVNPNAWARVSEIVYRIRREYNPDQYINWEYLVREEQQYYARRGR